VSKRTRNSQPTRAATASRPGTGTGAASGTEPVSGRTRLREPQRQRSAFERYRGLLLGIGVAAVVLVVGGALFLGASSPAYACTSILQPEPAASAAPGETPRLGQVTRDLGRNHVATGTSVTYEFCPPTSGSHYNATGSGPIPDLFYAQDEATVPEGWVHNMEHGAMVVLYRCPEGCGTAAQAALGTVQSQLPASPLCGFPPSSDVVVTRFDQMPTPYAAVVWGRVLFLNTLDMTQISTFYAQSADRGPEPWCQQAMPGSAPSPGAATSPAASPVASPSPAAASPSATAPSPSPTKTP
jgi:hypothetical protein